jgi:hypothetical protein
MEEVRNDYLKNANGKKFPSTPDQLSSVSAAPSFGTILHTITQH